MSPEGAKRIPGRGVPAGSGKLGKGIAMRIQYQYLDDFCGLTGAWTGDANEAVEAAVDYLEATRTKRGYMYLAPETNEAYRLTKRETMEAGAAILAGADGWYSLWCSHTGRRLSDLTRDKYFSRT